MAMTPTMKALRWMVALGLLSAACADGREGDATGPQPELLLHPISGDGQVATPGESLALPLVVQVRDMGGRGVAGVRVAWYLRSGHGAFNTPNPAVTGADGRAFTSFTPSTARAELLAAIDGRAGSAVLFRMTPPLTALFERPSCALPGCESIAFFADHSFSLWYLGVPDWLGTYSLNGRVVELTFEEEDWRATATMLGDSLVVTYNFDANMSGFEDGTFRLTRGEMPPGT